MEKKNYERPVMGIETFVPNQFIAACWVLHLECMGTQYDKHNHPQVYIFTQPTDHTTPYLPDQMIEHAPHAVGTWVVQADTKPDPLDINQYVSELNEFAGVSASQSAVSPGNQTFVPGAKTDEYTMGYAWRSIAPHTEYVYCFTTSADWELKGEGSGPNAS